MEFCWKCCCPADFMPQRCVKMVEFLGTSNALQDSGCHALQPLSAPLQICKTYMDLTLKVQGEFVADGILDLLYFT